MAAVFAALRILLGAFFALAGAAKLSARPWPALHGHLHEQFGRFARVFPLRALGYEPEPRRYLEAVGCVELLAGLLLAAGPRRPRDVGTAALCVVMMGAIYTLLALREPLAMCAPATVCLGLLLLLHVRGRAASAKAKFE